MIRRHYELVIFAPKNKGISNRMYWRIVFAFAGIKRDDEWKNADYRENKPECPTNTRTVYKVEEWGRTEKNRGVVADGRDGCGLSC